MSNTNGHPQRYRIKSVATITGLSTHVIRKWEERYHLLQPHRSANGYRTFTEEDIQLLLFIKAKLIDGESIGELARSGSAYLCQAMQQMPINVLDIPPAYQKDAEELIQAARKQIPDRVKQPLEEWANKIGLKNSMVKIIFPLLQVIGDLWHRGGISISGEHCVSQLVRQQLLAALRPESSQSSAQAIVACVPEDYHEIAPLTVTLFLQHLGWEGTYLGPNVSFDVLKMALRRKQPQLMILSCTMEPPEKTIKNWLKDIIHTIQPKCQVVTGGTGFFSYAELLKQHSIPYLQNIQDINMFPPKHGVANHPNRWVVQT